MGILELVKRHQEEQIQKEWMEKGMEKGIEKGMEKGTEITHTKQILRLDKKGFSPEETSDLLGVELDFVLKVLAANKS